MNCTSSIVTPPSPPWAYMSTGRLSGAAPAGTMIAPT